MAEPKITAGSAARSEADSAPAVEAPRVSGAKWSAPIGIRCLACGSDDLDAAEAPRGDDPVHCRACDAWHTYLQLEIAAVEAVRRDRVRRGSR
ncbi:MAG TPA: hypothetical protein VFS55_10350 [Dokdonella sp.]|nr:hypothetical protein [Dokdonella sp.]